MSTFEEALQHDAARRAAEKLVTAAPAPRDLLAESAHLRLEIAARILAASGLAFSPGWHSEDQRQLEGIWLSRDQRDTKVIRRCLHLAELLIREAEGTKP